MKKTISAFVLCVMAIQLSAQSLIKADFQKDETATYTTTIKTAIANPMSVSAEVTSNIETKYTVQDVTDKGFTIESLVTKVEIQGANEEVNDSQTEFYKNLLNIPFIITTDINGKPEHIKNYPEVSKKITDNNANYIEQIYKKHPDIAQLQPKDKILANLNSKVTEETLLKQQTDNWGFFKFFGKTLKNGDIESEISNGMKVKNIYTIAPILGTTVITETTTADMTEDEEKEFILGQLAENGIPEEQIEQMKTNWSQLAATGMTKVDINATTTYRMLKKGWMQEITCNSVNKIIGMDMKVNTYTKLAEQEF